MQKKCIVFTGGGTAGHVVVNLALIPEFLEEGYDVHYIGSYKGIERDLVTTIQGVTYHGIATGKLRRYLSKENIKDPFRVMKGVFQSIKLLKKIKPGIVFSKGGFVSVPVIMAAKLTGTPAIIHESDYTPGLANKIASKFAKYVLTQFPETTEYLPDKKAKYVGAIIRDELFTGNRKSAFQMTNFSPQKPIILVMGGSAGAKRINEAIRESLPALLKDFQIIHLCGKGKEDPTIKQKGYVQYEYVTDELKDLFSITDLVISRAGANAIFEFLALRIPMLLIPLPKSVSRGDQILNAESFKKQGYALVLEEEQLTNEKLINSVQKLNVQKPLIQEKMQSYKPTESKNNVIKLINDTIKK
ncbi:undecaprenyldiphospho-muramoylpentapeptide beta-N-acetylglucosaminyltransferase [Bacillaceae bacterium W0354]